MDSILDFLKNIDWATISSNVVVVGLLFWAAIKLYAKTLIEEKVKSGFSSALEEFKADLEKKNIAFEANYTLYVTERTKVCIELYKKLVDYYDNVYQVLCLKSVAIHNSNEISENELRKRDIPSKQEISVVRDYFYQNKIFIPDPLCRHIVEFINGIRTNRIDFNRIYDSIISEKRDDYKRDEYIGRLNKICSSVGEYYKELDIIGDYIRELIQPETEKQ